MAGIDLDGVKITYRFRRNNGKVTLRMRVQKQQKLWLYGWHAVLAAWANPDRLCHTLYISENNAAEFAERALVATGLKRPAPDMVDRKRLDRLLSADAVHQGIALEVTALVPLDMHDLARMAEVRERALFMMLDQVTDPHNVGAIMRSAAAFGAAAIIMQDRHAPEVTGVLAKAASGAVEHVPLAYVTNLSQTLDKLNEAGCQTVAFDERGTPLPAVPLTAKCVLVMGAEGKGLRPSVKAQCDTIVSLPTAEFSTLNVSNAAAVGLYEWARQQG